MASNEKEPGFMPGSLTLGVRLEMLPFPIVYQCPYTDAHRFILNGRNLPQTGHFGMQSRSRLSAFLKQFKSSHNAGWSANNHHLGFMRYDILYGIINKKGSTMLNIVKTSFFVLLFVATSIAAYAETKVVVIPMSGDSLKPLANIITVAKQNGDFDDPVAAINAIGNSFPAANEENPYLIVIAPGVYNLSEQLVMKEYVSISGSGQHVTKLTGSIASSGGTSSALVVGKDNTSLRDLTIANTDAIGTVSLGIHNDYASPIISNIKIIVTGGSDQMGIYNGYSFPVISNVTIFVSGGSGNQYGIRNRLTSAPEISNVSITVEDGIEGQTGILNAETYNLPSPKISNVKIQMSGGSLVNTGIQNFESSPNISKVEIVIIGTNANQYGIYNQSLSGKNTSPFISEASIKVEGGSAQYGVYNWSSRDSAKIFNSTIIASNASVRSQAGINENETYISNSILTGSVTDEPECSFVFTNLGVPLDENCDLP